MAKYKLIKSLPKFKVGDIMEISKRGNLVKRDGELSNGVIAFTKYDLEHYPEILREWFQKIPERPKTVWDLKTDDILYVIEDGRVAGGFWNNGDYTANRDAGDVFLTKEEAEKELARRKAKVILERDTKGFKPNFKSPEQYKWFVYFNIKGKILRCDFDQNWVEGKIYFASYSDAVASIKAHPNEWKTYLGVEE